MAKLFAVTILVIAILSAIPIIRNTYHPVEDISTHGQAIDDQLSETMWEAGISFLASQIILAWLIWRFSGNRPGEKTKSFPGGAAGLEQSGDRSEDAGRTVEILQLPATQVAVDVPARHQLLRGTLQQVVVPQGVTLGQ